MPAVAIEPTKFPTYTIVQAEYAGGGDPAARPGHHHQVVAGEQLGPGDDDEDQPGRR
jgi:hypothetical protein